MGKIAKDSRLHGIHGLLTVTPKNLFIRGWRTGVSLSLFISQEMLTQQQVFHPLIPEQRQQIRKQRRVIFHFQAHMDPDLAAVTVTQFPDDPAVIGKLFRIHSDAGYIALRENLRRMVRKTQNIKALLYGTDYIILFAAYGMVTSPGVGMIVGTHGNLSFCIIGILVYEYFRYCTTKV